MSNNDTKTSSLLATLLYLPVAAVRVFAAIFIYPMGEAWHSGRLSAELAHAQATIKALSEAQERLATEEDKDAEPAASPKYGSYL